MAGSAIVSGNGVVMIPIPEGGATGEVLTKLSNEDYDFDWAAGGGGAGNLQQAYDNATAPPQITLNATPDPFTVDASVAGDIFALRDAANADLVRVGDTGAILLQLTSTTQALGIMTMTTVQKNAIANTAGAVVYDTDLGQLQQNDGAGWSTPGAGLTTLQNAYDNSLGANPMILLDAVPTPISIRASVSGAVFEVEDVGAANTMFQIDADPDLITMRTGVTIADAFINGGAAVSLTLADTYTQTGAFIGGGILSNGTVTTGVSTTWIWALLQESKRYQININPAFAAFTLFNALATIANLGNFNLVQAIILNNGVAHARTTAGTSTTAQNIGLSHSPQTRAEVAGAVMTKTTGDQGVTSRPTYSTVAGSTVNFGTTRGLWVRDIAVALFQPGAGTENVTAHVAVEVDALVTGGNITKRALRSALTAASNTLMIENTGGAASDFGAGSLHFDDNANVNFGNTVAAPDVSTAWNSVLSSWQFAFALNASQLQWSNPATNRFLFDNSGDSTDGEYNFNCARFSLGAQTGAVGNQVGVFVTPARTITVAGDWADFLLTQANSLTVNALAMGRVSAWVINPVSYAASTGSVANADTLTVGGFPTSSPGVTITNRQSLNVIGGRSRHAAVMSYDPRTPGALAAGDTNDYSGLLTGTANNGMRHFVRLEGDGAGTSRITGIDATAAQDGDCFKLCNVSANNVTLGDQNVGSVAANRIITGTGADYILGADENCEIIYDATTARWRLLYGTGA